jgi:hypothetical protein
MTSSKVITPSNHLQDQQNTIHFARKVNTLMANYPFPQVLHENVRAESFTDWFHNQGHCSNEQTVLPHLAVSHLRTISVDQ